MKKFLFLLLVLAVLLCGCADIPADNSTSAEDPMPAVTPGEGATSSESPSTAANTTGDNTTTVEGTETSVPGTEPVGSDINIPLLKGETLHGATTVTISGSIPEVSSIQMTVAMLSHGDFPNDSIFYIDARDADGNIVCFRRLPGYGFIAKSDTELTVFVVKGIPDGNRVSGDYLQMSVSDLDKKGRLLDHWDFLCSYAEQPRNRKTDFVDIEFTVFAERSAHHLSDQKNLTLVAEMKPDGTKAIAAPGTPVTEETINTIRNLKSTDFAEWFR